MSKKNKTRYALLGTLLDQPCTGYEIKQFMKRSTAYFWKESDSTIYPMLKLLEKEGKVTSRVGSVGKKKKVSYSITDLGRKELKEWLKSPTDQETGRNEFLLKLFFASSPETLNNLLKERLTLKEDFLHEYEEIEKRLGNLPSCPKRNLRLSALDYGLRCTIQEIKWIKEMMREDKIFNQ